MPPEDDKPFGLEEQETQIEEHPYGVPDPQNEEEVSLEPEEDDDEPQRPNRKERRRQRYQDMQREKDDALRVAEDAKRDAAEARREAEHQRRMSETRVQQPTEDPFENDANLQNIYSEQKQLLQDWGTATGGGPATPEQEKDFEKRGRKLESRKLARVSEIQSQRNAPTPEERIQHTRMAAMQAKYADVTANAEAIQWAQGEWQKMRAKGAKNDDATLESAMDMARTEFGLNGGGQRPRDQRSQLTGTPAGRGAGGRTAPKTVKMDPAHKELAYAMYPKMAPAEAVKTWARDIGSKNPALTK